ncbi:MAG: pyridoxamine 5'-phosphate oxidase [Pseudomonadota bacterium]|nr:pyridoxamine 5'-phosphate oxidase [Pseudomonadota bacterium]
MSNVEIEEYLNSNGCEPIDMFKKWLREASNSEPVNPNACSLATAGKSGKPSVRMVLLKHVDEEGFIFYTNAKSRKGLDLKENPWASLCFYWKSLGREVRVDGSVERVAGELSDDYFSTRSRASQIGAWASKQSCNLENRALLESRVEEFTKKFENIRIPRPDFWCGYRIKHIKVEFWVEKASRLHDRFVFNRTEGDWQIDRLYP